MEEERVNSPVEIGLPKNISDPQILNGKFEGKFVTVVPNTNQVVLEKSIIGSHVLRYVARTQRYVLFDPYICTLEELILLIAKKIREDQIACTPEELALLRKFRFLDSNNRPTPEGLQLLRGIIKGLDELYKEHICHGDLNVKNIVICSSAKGRLVAKLTRIKGGRPKQGGGADYNSLGQILQECFSYDDPEGKKQFKIPAEVDELQNCIWKFASPTNGLTERQWNNLVDSMENDFIKAPRTLLKHPMFWDANMGITFMIQFGILMRQCMSFKNSPRVRSFLSAVNNVHTCNWYGLLPEVVQKSKAADSRTTDETRYLLGYIRNIYCHFDDQTEAFVNEVGTPPEELFEYFRAKYPEMLLRIHRVMQFYFAAVKQATKFKYSFEDYI